MVQAKAADEECAQRQCAAADQQFLEAQAKDKATLTEAGAAKAKAEAETKANAKAEAEVKAKAKADKAAHAGQLKQTKQNSGKQATAPAVVHPFIVEATATWGTSGNSNADLAIVKPITVNATGCPSHKKTKAGETGGIHVAGCVSWAWSSHSV